MPNRLDIPSELDCLIEKRELADRRQQDCPGGQTEGKPEEGSPETVDRRSTSDRRKSNNSQQENKPASDQ